MNAYLINGTELYAANDMVEAMDVHCSLTNDNHGTIDSVDAITDMSMPIADDDSGVTTKALGEVLATIEKPCWIASGEMDSDEAQKED